MISGSGLFKALKCAKHPRKQDGIWEVMRAIAPK
jgi:hypothetical protein